MPLNGSWDSISQLKRVELGHYLSQASSCFCWLNHDLEKLFHKTDAKTSLLNQRSCAGWAMSLKLSVFYYIRLSCANRHAQPRATGWKPLNEDWQQQKQEHRNGQMNQIRASRSWRMSQWRPQQMTAGKEKLFGNLHWLLIMSNCVREKIMMNVVIISSHINQLAYMLG